MDSAASCSKSFLPRSVLEQVFSQIRFNFYSNI
ncbi:hypothetical protein VQ7734_01909 [Vibrio quintilis]|uniref:Uncharacterized protein n=1 Tax=Vibrio quintilis TaxID=1117707 RepID=A0A1M7YU63_9VIBR|nr:hypothetical protein VQ7734_01909 [Vibrio quintilis]